MLRQLSPRARRFALWAVLFACHVGLTLYFVRPDTLGKGPIVGADWDTHVEQCARALEAWRGYRKLWGYDVQLFAGSLSGTIFDADNKMHELFVVALTALGTSAAAAFNAFVLLCHLAVPISAYASARLFGLSTRAATLSAVLAIALWFFDSSIHWGWWIGSISWAFGAALAPLPVALFYRFTTERSFTWLVAMLFALLVTLYVHPFTFFLMALPVVALFMRSMRDGLSLAQHMAVVGVAILAFASNLWWILVAVRFSGYVVDPGSVALGHTSLSTLVWDYFGYLQDPLVTGYIAVRTSFRFLTLVAAGIGIWRWHKARDARALPLAVAVFVPFLLTYTGGHLHALRQLQPMRFIFGASFFGAIVAGAELDRLVEAFGEWSKPPSSKVVVALLGVVALPKLALDVWYYFPQATPKNEHLRAAFGDPIGGAFDNTGLVWGLHRSYAHYPMNDDEHRLIAFVREHDDAESRWLVDWGVLGERLTWATRAQVLGGFPYFNMQHNDANWFRLLGPARDPRDLAAYLDTYNVGWLIRTTALPELDRADLFEPVTAIGPHRIYRVRTRSTFLVGATAHVNASFNRIEVRNSSGGSFVLKYHFLETLVCRPNCQIERAPVPGDRVGFIRVLDAPADFEIVNGY